VNENPNASNPATGGGLNESDLDPNPIRQFDKWFQDAVAAKLPEPTAMTLATASKDGVPSARIVLLKECNEQGFAFYTNYQSQKGLELAGNPRAALVFHWVTLERQVRVTGSVTKVSREESEKYFHARPRLSQMGAWASHQSQTLANREELENRLAQVTANYQNKEIPLPPYWGGYRVTPVTIEFWQGRPNRLHDRFRYSRSPDNSWRVERLSP
jgi:pyridoxamine 5'-phosphate oxidase